MKKLLMGLSLLLVCGVAQAGNISFDQLATSSDLTVSKYNSDLNTIYADHNGNINSANILNDSVAEADMADDANPRLRTYEGAACEMVDDGLLPTTVAGLTATVPAGTAYPLGYRVDKTSGTSVVVTADCSAGAGLTGCWAWIDIDINGLITSTEDDIGAGTPSVANNSIRLARVSSDGTDIVSVQDLRVTSCTSGPFENIVDLTGEATLEHFFSSGRPGKGSSKGFLDGLQVSYDTASTFNVLDGSAYINGFYRTASGDLTVSIQADDPSVGTSGLDSGTTLSANETYYVYAVADKANSPNLSITYSTSATAPSGLSSYRKIGSIMTNAASQFAPKGVASITPGRLVQMIVSQDATVTNCTAIVPEDDTIPAAGEGCGILTAKITPQAANNRILAIGDAWIGGASTTVNIIGVVSRDNGGVRTIAASENCTVGGAANGPACRATTRLDGTAGTTETITYTYSVGPFSAATIHVNSDEGGNRLFGGSSDSSITLMEYEGE